MERGAGKQFIWDHWREENQLYYVDCYPGTVFPPFPSRDCMQEREEEKNYPSKREEVRKAFLVFSPFLSSRNYNPCSFHFQLWPINEKIVLFLKDISTFFGEILFLKSFSLPFFSSLGKTQQASKQGGAARGRGRAD